jgi:hypothetical protein
MYRLFEYEELEWYGYEYSKALERPVIFLRDLCLEEFIHEDIGNHLEYAHEEGATIMNEYIYT